MTETVQVTLHKGEISTGCELCLDTVLRYVEQPTLLCIILYLNVNIASRIISCEVIQVWG
jgi:hypothetical protein